MEEGILASVEVRDPEGCPVTSLAVDGDVQSVTHGRGTTGTVPVEVTVDGDAAPDHGRPVFSYESGTVYRLERTADQGCACDRIEARGCPVREVRATDGAILFRFIVADQDRLRTVISDLRSRDGDVSIRCLHRSGAGTESAPVFVDRNAFTDRQREVVRRAHELGYFERPKRANASEVAAELDISPSTFADHLAAAQTTLMDALFDC